jgi:hypothetical protein
MMSESKTAQESASDPAAYPVEAMSQWNPPSEALLLRIHARAARPARTTIPRRKAKPGERKQVSESVPAGYRQHIAFRQAKEREAKRTEKF